MVAAMKRMVAAALMLLAAAPAAAAERRYSVTDFDRVQVDGPYRVTLVTGRASAALASGSPAALDRVSVDVQGRTLRIRRNRSAWGGYPGEAAGVATIEIATRELRAASVSGSGSLGVDRVRGLRVDLAVAGNGRLVVAEVDADNLLVGLIGSGSIVLSGRAKQLNASVRGSGDLDAADLRADDAVLIADTAGAIALGAERTARVTAIGEGDVEIIGAPACTLLGPQAASVRCGAIR
jgi:hypothetical protein